MALAGQAPIRFCGTAWGSQSWLMPPTFWSTEAGRSHFNRDQSRPVESVSSFPDDIGIANLGLGPGRADLGVGEAIPDAGIEVPSFGLGSQQLPKSLLGNAEVTINGPASEFQLQNRALVLVGSSL